MCKGRWQTSFYQLFRDCGQTDDIKRQIKTIRMTCCGRIIQESTFKVRNSLKCRNVNLPESNNAINSAATNFIHKLLRNKKPVQIFEKYSIPRRPRGIYPIRPKKPGMTIRTNRTLLMSSLDVYNHVPELIRCLEFPQFRQRVKKLQWPWADKCTPFPSNSQVQEGPSTNWIK